jgi:phosphoglucosamine mutase
VFEELGADLTVIADQPDGLNINRDCGSTHLGALQARVRETGALLGIALDGDGDRCLMVDAQGTPVDGDQLLFAIARMRLADKGLPGPVVGTLMSNLGLEQAIRAMGIEFLRAKVGDRYVMELLKTHGGVLGGETSGHVICLDKATTGDGIVTALQVLTAIVREGRGLADLIDGMQRFPQVLINVRLTGSAADAMVSAAVAAAQAEVVAQLGSRGRVLLRPSGTEPLIRVMVEAEEEDAARRAAEYLAAAVREVCGTNDRRGS